MSISTARAPILYTSMVSNTTPAPFVFSAQEYYSSYYDVYYMSSGGLNGRYWSSKSQSSPYSTWFQIDLGKTYNLAGFDWAKGPSEQSFPYDLSVKVSDNNIDFTTVVDYYGLNGWQPNVVRKFTFDEPVMGRYIRFYIHNVSTDGNTLTSYSYKNCEFIQIYEAGANTKELEKRIFSFREFLKTVKTPVSSNVNAGDPVLDETTLALCYSQMEYLESTPYYTSDDVDLAIKEVDRLEALVNDSLRISTNTFVSKENMKTIVQRIYKDMETAKSTDVSFNYKEEEW